MRLAVLEPTREASAPPGEDTSAPGLLPNKQSRRGTAADARARCQQTRPTSYTRRRSSPGALTQHPTVRARPLEYSSAARAWDTCTERSRTRRHFSGGGRVQREDARGRLARLLYCGYLAVFWQHHKKLPRYLKTTPRSPKDSFQGLEQRPEAGGCVFVVL